MHMAPALLLAVLCKVKLTMCTDVPEHQVDTLKNGTFLKEKKKKRKKHKAVFTTNEVGDTTNHKCCAQQ